MSTSQVELKMFLDEMYRSDVARGMFMVFDALFHGFTISENRTFARNEDSKEIHSEVVSKVITLSNGIFNLVRYRGADEIWFIVGDIHQGFNEYGYDLESIVDIAIDLNYNPDVFFDESDDDDEFVNPSIFVTQWQEHIAPCLDNPKKLKEVLKKISATLLHQGDFLIDFGDSHGFTGMAADELLGDDYTDKNFEIIFKVFVKNINENLIPQLEF